MSIQQFLSVKKPTLQNLRLIVEDDNDESENLSKLLKPYKGVEFLPINIINDLIKYSFESSEILHDYSGYHKIIKVKVSDLLTGKITNWKYNRPADLTRCGDIARYIYLSKNIVDTMLYVIDFYFLIYLKQDTDSALKQVTARGGKPIVICSEKDT